MPRPSAPAPGPDHAILRKAGTTPVEELETSREELQSINEELGTVNAELKSRVEELARSNSDLQNLMGATSIATLFLDEQLRMHRHTPPSVELFNLVPSDTGRPLSDLAHRLEFNSLADDAGRVLRGLVPVEREVRGAQGRWYLARIIPYRTVENRIAGVVLTFVDVTERKLAEANLRQAHETLERRVEERTAELDRTNQALRVEIEERSRARQERQDLLRQLVTAQEAERSRISRELHDQVGQHLTALMLGLKSLEPALSGKEAARTLESLMETAETVGHDVHELALELRPTALDDLGLLRTLADYAEKWAARAKVEVGFHSEGLEAGRLPRHVETVLYRIACEALNNVLKHARAKHVSIILERRGDQAKVIVEDDGRGFDPEEQQRAENKGCIGLLSMRERATLLDGELIIESAPGAGTTVFARVPSTEKRGARPDATPV